MRKAFNSRFTPLETIGRQRRDSMSLSGFTLAEIMIVVAIVILLVTLAVPNILRSRVIANEGTALGNLRAINNACQLYSINNQSYPAGLSDLVEPTSNPAYIDSVLATGQKQGYAFIYTLVSLDSFTVNANPLATGLLKGRYFYLDESGIVRGNSSGPAGPNDQIVG